MAKANGGVLQKEVRTIKDVFTIKNQTDSSADLFIYGDIINNTGWKWDDSMLCRMMKNILGQLDDKSNLNIYVNSGGGSVFAGLAIYNMLKRNKAQKLFMWMVLQLLSLL